MAANFDEIIEILLYEIYEHYRVTSTTDPIDDDFLNNLAQKGISPMFARKAIGILKIHDRVVQTRGDPVEYEITVKGIRSVDASLADSESFLHRHMIRSDDSVPSKGLLEEQAHKDEWEPLKIDRETPHYRHAVVTIEDVIETVTGDNGYAANEPEERNHILWSLNEGLAALKEALPQPKSNSGTDPRAFKFLSSKIRRNLDG